MEKNKVTGDMHLLIYKYLYYIYKYFLIKVEKEKDYQITYVTIKYNCKNKFNVNLF